LLFEIGSEEHLAHLRKEEEIAIAVERINAESLGVVEEFDKYVGEGRFREYLPSLNYKKLLRKRDVERKIYFAFGVIAGIFVCYLCYVFIS